MSVKVCLSLLIALIMNFFKKKPKAPVLSKEEWLRKLTPDSLDYDFVPESYWRDKDFFYRVLEINHFVNRHAPTCVTKNTQNFIQAINTNPKFFHHYLEYLRQYGKNRKPFINNYEIMLNAVTQEGSNLLKASTKLLKNCKLARELAMAAVKQDGSVYWYMIKEEHKFLNIFRDDLEVVQEASKTYPNIIFYISSEFKQNPVVARNIILGKPEHFKMYSSTLLKDKEFCMSLIRSKAAVVKYINWINLDDDKTIFELVTKHNPEIIKYAPKSLRENLKFNLKLIEANGAVFPHLVERFKRNPFAQVKAIEAGVDLREVEKYVPYDKTKLATKELSTQLSAFAKSGIVFEDIEKHIFYTLDEKERKLPEVIASLKSGTKMEDVVKSVLEKNDKLLKKGDVAAFKLFNMFEKANEKFQSKKIQNEVVEAEMRINLV